MCEYITYYFEKKEDKYFYMKYVIEKVTPNLVFKNHSTVEKKIVVIMFMLFNKICLIFN